MNKNVFLFFFSILFSLLIIEFLLFFFGKYDNLVINNLEPSPAIYERSHSSIQRHKHPDLNYIIINKFDTDGVKNFGDITTSSKKNIIGIFGDSFTENIAIDKKFEFSTLLNQTLKNYKVVNYGTGGYSADQIFIRYLKYKNHDLKHVFYLFNYGDKSFQTKSIFNDDGSYLIDYPELNNFYNTIGKIRLTYLVIDGYFILKNIFNTNFTLSSEKNYKSILANKIYKKLYGKVYQKCDLIVDYQCKKNLINLLKIFKKEVENNGASFHIIVNPNNNNILFFKDIMTLTNENFSYFFLDKNLLNGTIFEKKKINFLNDSHWNEYGNYLLAKNLKSIFNKVGIKSISDNFNINFQDIDLFYENNF